MNSTTALLLTLINIVACLIFPKLLFIVLNARTKRNKEQQTNLTTRTVKSAITSFPYCTSYPLTGGPVCKFSPDFCGKCSVG